MKKVTAMLLSLSMIVGLTAGCSQPGTQPTPTSGAVPTQSASAPKEGNWWEEINFDKSVNLTMAMAGAPNSGSGKVSEKAVELMKERSGGAIQVEIVYNGGLGNEQSCFSQCMEGSIDFTGAGVGTISQYTKWLDILQMPFLINDYEQERELMKTDEWKALVDKANEELQGVSIINITEFGMRHFATVKAPINTIDDIRGLKIRSIGNPVIDEALSMVGANPVNITFTDLYSSLQNNVVDGEEINTSSVSMQKHYEVVKYFSEIGLYPFLTLSVMSDATAASLPEGYLDLILACFEEGNEWYMSEALYAQEDEYRQDCLNNGLVFNEIEDKDTWIETVKPLYEEKAAEDPLYAAFIEKALSIQ